MPNIKPQDQEFNDAIVRALVNKMQLTVEDYEEEDYRAVYSLSDASTVSVTETEEFISIVHWSDEDEIIGSLAIVWKQPMGGETDEG